MATEKDFSFEIDQQYKVIMRLIDEAKMDGLCEIPFKHIYPENIERLKPTYCIYNDRIAWGVAAETPAYHYISFKEIYGW